MPVQFANSIIVLTQHDPEKVNVLTLVDTLSKVDFSETKPGWFAWQKKNMSFQHFKKVNPAKMQSVALHNKTKTILES